jgi:hypothetical protein
MGFLILRDFWQFVNSKNDKWYFKILYIKYEAICWGFWVGTGYWWRRSVFGSWTTRSLRTTGSVARCSERACSTLYIYCFKVSADMHSSASNIHTFLLRFRISFSFKPQIHNPQCHWQQWSVPFVELYWAFIFRDGEDSLSDVTATVVGAREASSLSLGHKSPAIESSMWKRP